MNRITSLTQRLRALEKEVLTGPTPSDVFSFADGRYTIRVANDLETRKKAYGLVYQLYLEKEYAKPHPSKMWLSIFDALPETVTLLVERQAEGLGLRAEGTAADCVVPSAFGLQASAHSAPVGALTVVFDSPMGLPADKVYRPELDALRASGRRLAEIISLGVADEAGAGSEVLVGLFNFVYLIARRLRAATDFVITVNPRHSVFYRRKFFFAEAGPERSYGKVGGAPALLLSIPLDTPDHVTERERERTVYKFWMSAEEERRTILALKKQLIPMTQHELGYFLVAETDILNQATPEQREFLGNRYAIVAPDASSGGVRTRK